MDEAFIKLLMAHHSMLHSFVYAQLLDVHLTDDVLQEAALVLWSKFPTYQQGSDFGAWARSIA